MRSPDDNTPRSGTRPIPSPPPPPPSALTVESGDSFDFRYDLSWTKLRGTDRNVHVECFLLILPRVQNPNSVTKKRIDDLVMDSVQRVAIPGQGPIVNLSVRTKPGLRRRFRILVVATAGNTSGYRLFTIVPKKEKRPGR